MSKGAITGLFLGAVVAVVAGWVIAIVAFAVALGAGVIEIGGPDVVIVDGGAVASSLGILAIAVLLVTGGTIAALVSWIGALFNTARLDDKTWFVVLLVLGLWSFGFVAMIAYVLAGPDGASQGADGPEMAIAPQG